jgi:hypothetical protein
MVAQSGFAANLPGLESCPSEEVGQAILPADWLFSQSSRLKGGSGHDWPPHKKQHEKIAAQRTKT